LNLILKHENGILSFGQMRGTNRFQKSFRSFFTFRHGIKKRCARRGNVAGLQCAFMSPVCFHHALQANCTTDFRNSEPDFWQNEGIHCTAAGIIYYG
jgi:hypothetical protein